MIPPVVTSGSTSESTLQDIFAIYGTVGFAPFYVPTRMTMEKARNLDRTENFCGTEDVSDIGSKNRELHISGPLLEKELDAFNELLDCDEPLEVTAPAWSGEIRVVDGEVEGPGAIDPSTHQTIFRYSMNLVSTGRDESGDHTPDDGIIDEGDANHSGGDDLVAP